MEIAFTYVASEDLSYFKKSGNQSVLKKIRSLLESIQAAPFAGIGKPEALKYEQFRNWSRRISQEHRLVYEVQNSVIPVHSLYQRFHK